VRQLQVRRREVEINMGGNAFASARPFPAAASGNAKKAGRGRLLVVEDDFLVCAQYEQVLAEAGFDIVGTVHSAEAAVRAAGERRPDLVIMDIRLSGDRDGIDAALDIRRQFDIASLFVTAYSDAAIRERAADAAPADWLVKPVGNAQLAAAVRRAPKASRATTGGAGRPAASGAAAAQPSGERLRVLIVEDDMLHRLSLVGLMQDRGFDTEQAASAGEALAIVRDRPPLHVAIVDLGLPDMDGRALVGAARALQPDLKVIYATGYEASAVPEAEADPLSRYLPKPFDQRQLAVVFESFGWTMPTVGGPSEGTA